MDHVDIRGAEGKEKGELINFPDDDVVAQFVVIGKGIKPAGPRPAHWPAGEVVSTDRFTA